MNVSLTLPWPPSVNAMWRTPRSGKLAGRTLLSAEGRAYRQRVAVQVMVQRIPRHTIKGKLGVYIVAYPPDRRSRDIDNLLKALLDSVQHAGVIESDADVDVLHIARSYVVPRGSIKLVIDELPAATTVPERIGKELGFTELAAV